MAYNCIMTLHQQQPGDNTYTNQTEKTIAKVGMHRIRAMELLKTLFVSLGRMKDGKSIKQLVSVLLKQKVIDSMLYMIKTFPFCSISHQQCIQIMNALKEAFEPEDIAVLKNFILTELESQENFEFPSGRKTSGMNMGQITQIAFELRNLTQKAFDDESSDAEADDEEEETKLRREEMNVWAKFCKRKIDKIEKVWNKKLEDSTHDDSDENDDQEPKAVSDDDSLSNEDTINQLLMNLGNNDRFNRSNVDHIRQDQTSIDLKAATESLKPQSKDDNDLLKKLAQHFDAKVEYAQNNYWRHPEQHDIDELK